MGGDISARWPKSVPLSHTRIPPACLRVYMFYFIPQGSRSYNTSLLFLPHGPTPVTGFLVQWGWRRLTEGTGPAVRHGRCPEPTPPRPVHAAGVADVSAHPRGAHRPQRERRKEAGSSLLKRRCRTSASLSHCLLAGA